MLRKSGKSKSGYSIVGLERGKWNTDGMPAHGNLRCMARFLGWRDEDEMI
jgi:hypothetical protein